MKNRACFSRSSLIICQTAPDLLDFVPRLRFFDEKQPTLGAKPFGSPSSPQTPKAKQFNVVIAEDERDLLGVFSSILSRSGFRVTRTFENGRDLVNFIKMNLDQEAQPDLIVTDLRMPLKDGIEASIEIRAIKPTIKIILASAYEVPREATELFDAILKKPFSKSDLIETVSRCLNMYVT